MKTCNLSLATVVVGALAISYSACSAQGEDNSYQGGPVSHAGNSTSSGGQVASGGSPTVPSGTAGSVTHPAGGSAPHAGGSFNTGVGGSTTSGGGRPGTGSGGTPTGGGGTPTAGGCKVAVGIAAEKLIDDLEDGDGTISGAGSRVGYWYTYNDGTGVQVPAPKSVFMGHAPGNTTSKLAAVTSGPAFTIYGAGMGFDFNNNGKSCPYDASAYSGIKFWAKANSGNMASMALTAMVKIPATTPTTADGGTCAAMCEDHYALKPAPVLTTTWTEYTITFATAATATFGQNSFGTVVPFDKSKILAMQFQVAKGVKFDFSVDDITFF
jgi:hypothetical protein